MKKQLLRLALIFLAGGLIGLWIGSNFTQTRTRGIAIRENDGAVFTNHLLICDSGTTNSTIFEDLRAKFSAIITEAQRSGQVEKVGISFRALNTGRGTDVGDAEKFTPGSLLKIPLMIAYLKQAEADPSLFDKRYVYMGPDDQNAAEHFKPSSPIGPGNSYSVRELLTEMISQSDNNAAAILAQQVDDVILDQTYSVLQFSPPTSPIAIDFISPKSFSYFLRVLYNATYLSTRMSEKALSFMAEENFAYGIRAGIPSTIKIAGKFGERELPSGAGVVSELHDCGIVYYPDYPYMLCVMTRGKNIGDLPEVIKNISLAAFDAVQVARQNGE